MSVFRFGIYVDELDDVFREIDIKGTQIFNDLHVTIANSFKLDLKQQASFFISNNRWQKINEITLGHSSVFETAFDGQKAKIEEVLPANGSRLIYFSEDATDMTFLIQIEEIFEMEDAKKTYPVVVKSKGTLSGSSGGIFDADMGYDEEDYGGFELDKPDEQ